jgi:hypothetical protein
MIPSKEFTSSAEENDSVVEIRAALLYAFGTSSIDG